MLDRILIGSSAEPSDPNFKNVTLLLHGDGSNGAQNNTFIDSSANNFTITRNGNTTQGSFSPYGSNWSNYFDGSGDNLTTPSNSAFAFGTGDFTVEFWAYCTQDVTSTSTQFGLYSSSSTNDAGSFSIFLLQGVWYVRIDGLGNDLTATASSSQRNAWTHFAVCRNSGTLTFYINGTSVASGNRSTQNVSQTQASLGILNPFTGYDFAGYISNVRVVKGTAVYTSAFTPSTTPLTAITNTSLLTCAYNRFRDGSTNNFTITRNGDVKVTNFAPFAPSSAYSTTTNGGSAYFDGSGDWLNTPSSLSLTSGTDFTLEFWLYPFAAFSSNRGLVACDGARFGLITEGGSIYFLSSSTEFDSNVNPVPGAWNHIALTRTSGTIRLFLNGTQIATASSNTDNWSSQGLRIGSNSGGEIIPQCYMSDVRWATTSFYSSAFTPPTAPLTAASGTQVLVGCKNAAIFDNSMKNDLETVGNAQISTSVKKFGTGSMYFDGSGDWLDSQSTSEIAIGGGDFTIEAWIYPTGVSGTDSVIFDFRNGNPSNNGPIMIIGAGSGNPLVYVAAGSARITGSGITLNTWSHVAVSRSGTSTKMFLNGTQTGSTYTDTNNYASPVRIRIGADDDGGANAYFIGYMDEFRVTKGVARYTANFTPPTAPFPNK